MNDLDGILTQFMQTESLMDGLREEALEASAPELLAHTVLSPALAATKLSEGLCKQISEPVLAEFVAVHRLKPALQAQSLTDPLPADTADAPLEELSAARLKPFLEDSKLTQSITDRVLQTIRQRAQSSIEGIPNLDWIATAFAVGFALVICISRWQHITDILTGDRWSLLFGAFGVLLSAAILLFNASRLVRMDQKIIQPIFGQRTTQILAKSEILVVQGFGLALIVAFCWLFLGVTDPSGIPLLM